MQNLTMTKGYAFIQEVLENHYNILLDLKENEDLSRRFQKYISGDVEKTLKNTLLYQISGATCGFEDFEDYINIFNENFEYVKEEFKTLGEITRDIWVQLETLYLLTKVLQEDIVPANSSVGSFADSLMKGIKLCAYNTYYYQRPSDNASLIINNYLKSVTNLLNLKDSNKNEIDMNFLLRTVGVTAHNTLFMLLSNSIMEQPIWITALTEEQVKTLFLEKNIILTPKDIGTIVDIFNSEYINLNIQSLETFADLIKMQENLKGDKLINYKLTEIDKQLLIKYDIENFSKGRDEENKITDYKIESHRMKLKDPKPLPDFSDLIVEDVHLEEIEITIIDFPEDNSNEDRIKSDTIKFNW